MKKLGAIFFMVTLCLIVLLYFYRSVFRDILTEE
jgi:hypothetical protein